MDVIFADDAAILITASSDTELRKAAKMKRCDTHNCVFGNIKAILTKMPLRSSIPKHRNVVLYLMLPPTGVFR